MGSHEWFTEGLVEGCIDGYNHRAESHPFTKADMERAISKALSRGYTQQYKPGDKDNEIKNIFNDITAPPTYQVEYEVIDNEIKILNHQKICI